MKRSIGIFSITLMFFGSSGFLDAMNFSSSKYSGYNLIYASGQIKEGDLYKLDSVYSNLNNNKQTIVVFNSNGGELDEGLKIGRYLKQKRIGTSVRENGICASSCALSFLGGRSKTGKRFMVLPSSSKLGFHSFYYKGGGYVKLTKVQKDMSKIFDYMAYVGAPNYIMSRMFKTDSENIYFVNNTDRKALGISSTFRYKNSYATLAKNRKNSYYNPEMKNYVREYLKSFNSLIASNGSVIYSDNRAFNSYGYKSWLTKNLSHINFRYIKAISSNKVEAKVIYELKNGKKICSKNRYRLSKVGNSWRIVTKKHLACSAKDSNYLRKISKALP